MEGPVTQLKQFGAFVQVTEDVEGMIHVGDIVHEKRINHPQDELKVGQVVRATVLENDREKRRLRLGLKQLQPTSLDEYIAEHKEGDVVTGRVSDVKGNRVTVELGEGVSGAFQHGAAGTEAGDSGRLRWTCRRFLPCLRATGRAAVPGRSLQKNRLRSAMFRRPVRFVVSG